MYNIFSVVFGIVGLILTGASLRIFSFLIWFLPSFWLALIGGIAVVSGGGLVYRGGKHV